MPWKAPWCRGTTDNPHFDWKTEFVKWIKEYKGWAKDDFHRGQYWEAEYKCPKCGQTKHPVKMRTNRQLRNAGITP